MIGYPGVPNDCFIPRQTGYGSTDKALFKNPRTGEWADADEWARRAGLKSGAAFFIRLNAGWDLQDAIDTKAGQKPAKAERSQNPTIRKSTVDKIVKFIETMSYAAYDMHYFTGLRMLKRIKKNPFVGKLDFLPYNKKLIKKLEAVALSVYCQEISD